MKNIIKQLIPEKFKQIFWKKLDILQFNRLPVQPCNLQNLRFTSSDELAKVFTDKSVAGIWDSKTDEINNLQLPEMTGGVNPGDQRAIFYLLTYLKSKTVLEIGTHIGCSTVNIGLAIKPIENSRLTTVDVCDVNEENTKPWLNYESKYSPKELLTKIGFIDRTEFVRMNSIDFLKNCNSKFDLIFLDGSHLLKYVYQEIPLALNLLNKNGVILLHDYFPDNKPLWSNNYSIYGPELAVKKLKKECGELDALPFGKLPWKTKLNSNYTSLAMLTRKNPS